MGTWAAGNFENDTAMDWVGDLIEGGVGSIIHDALSQVMEQSAAQQPSFVGRLLGRKPVEAYLEAPTACEALAAAEIVACWLGHPLSKLPDGIEDWIRKNSGDFSQELVGLARQAVTVIKTKSELKELWEEGGAASLAEWETAILDLERRLQK